MAAIALPAPGTELGPCAEPCKHTDCAETRQMAELTCEYCRLPIGYEQRFYTERQADGLMHSYHAICLYEHMDKS
jgi:hypothetical protein